MSYEGEGGPTAHIGHCPFDCMKDRRYVQCGNAPTSDSRFCGIHSGLGCSHPGCHKEAEVHCGFGLICAEPVCGDHREKCKEHHTISREDKEHADKYRRAAQSSLLNELSKCRDTD